MLKGKEFGEAIEKAIALKIRSGAVATKTAIANHFGVKLPSLADWIKKGSISKDKLPELWRYFSDVVGPEHWGLTEGEWPSGLNCLIEEISPRLGRDNENKPPKSQPGYVGFELLDVQASAGNGLAAQDFHSVIENINVLESWANTALGGDLSRIRLISARGTSMQGTVENGDVLFVDASVRAYDGDGIYVISRSGDVQVKRLQKLHGEVLAIISDNKHFDSEKLTGEAANSVQVCGRVLSAWTLKRFW